jgi:hypothetical protein
MFDIYLSSRGNRLLVVARGSRIPAKVNGLEWQKRRAALSVSAEIKAMVKKDGFYARKLVRSKRSNLSD